MFQQLAILVLLATSVSANTPSFHCGNSATINVFQVDDCMDLACLFYRGNNSTIWLNMTSSVAIPEIKVELIALNVDAAVEMHVLHETACDDLIVGDCPIEAGEVIVFKKIITIDTKWNPSIYLVTLRVHGYNNVNGEDGSTFACFLVPLLID